MDSFSFFSEMRSSTTSMSSYESHLPSPTLGRAADPDMVRGKRSGVDVQGSRIVKVEPGAVATTEINLPA